MVRLRRQVRKFVVLFPGRTGSTFLMSALRDHRHIRATGELIGPLRTAGAMTQEQAIRDWYRGSMLVKEHAVGFKTKLVDVCDRDRFRAVLDEYNCQVIVLARDNHIKHVVSRANAKRLRDLTDRWNRRPGDDELPPIEIDPDVFDEALKRVEAHQLDIDDWATSLDRAVLRLTYESLLRDKQNVFDQLCRFVGVAPEPMVGRTEKATNDDLRHALLNFDDLAKRYADTAYGPMFDDVATD